MLVTVRIKVGVVFGIPNPKRNRYDQANYDFSMTPTPCLVLRLARNAWSMVK